MPPCSHPSTLRHYKAISEFPDNWSGFKVLMKAVGIDCGPCRAPYAPLTKAEERQRLKAYAALQLS